MYIYIYICISCICWFRFTFACLLQTKNTHLLIFCDATRQAVSGGGTENDLESHRERHKSCSVHGISYTKSESYAIVIPSKLYLSFLNQHVAACRSISFWLSEKLLALAIFSRILYFDG